MSIEEVTEWALIFNAYVEGRTIQTWEEEKYWVDIEDLNTDILFKGLGRVRIKPRITTRLMNHQELSDWLRSEPHEYRECKYKGETTVWHSYAYDEDEAIIPCENILIRKNHGKWIEPIIEVEK